MNIKSKSIKNMKVWNGLAAGVGWRLRHGIIKQMRSVSLIKYVACLDIKNIQRDKSKTYAVAMQHKKKMEKEKTI